jgi:CheY-like chemotaxis protein
MNESTCAGILVVDDVRETIRESFSDQGYLASGARHGRDALDQLRDATRLPCVILLDIMMPVMDGRAFRAEQLLDPRLRGIPIVVVTANANLRQMEIELETSGAMRKPVSLKQLFKVAELHCGKPESKRSA